MKNFLRHLSFWREKISRDQVALFLDYDGTLSEIASTPEEAVLSCEMRGVLKALVGLKGVRVAIISGRSLRDLRRMVPVKGLSYVGSHGLEFQSSKGVSSQVPKRYLQQLAVLKKEFTCLLSRCPGMMLEEKPFSLAVHYRNVALVPERKIRAAIMNVCADALMAQSVAVMPGKKVVEILPPLATDKGSALKHLWSRWGEEKFFPVYIGDDRTDEAAFHALRSCGLTIRVGGSGKRSKAEYYLNSVDDVLGLLKMFLDVKIKVESRKVGTR
jgi:trehalose-phosphatase